MSAVAGLVEREIDIDVRSEIVFVASGRVEEDDKGRPRFHPDESGMWVAGLKRMAGRKVRVTVAREKERRSLRANAYLWGMVYQDALDGLRELAVTAGETCPFADKDEVHEAFKYLFLGTEVVRIPGGGEIERPATTTRLSSEQFCHYIERIGSWCADRRIYIRQPGEEVSA